MNIVLVGIKHSGKSTLGHRLALSRGSLFVDSDELIEANYMLKHGEKLSCREIFNLIGREAFRRLEAEAIVQLKDSTLEDDQERIIALGGGVADNPYISAELLKELGLMVFIRVDIDLAWERVERGGIPAYLLEEQEPRRVFGSLSLERNDFYSQYADLVIDVEEDDVEENLTLLTEKLEGHV